MRWAIGHQQVFVLDIRIQTLSCAAFESRRIPARDILGASMAHCDRICQTIAQLAHAGAGHRLRQPDRADRVRAALGARLFLDPALQSPITGAVTSSRSRSPCRTCCGASASRSAASSPTASARARAVRRRAPIRRRSRTDGACDQRADARSVGRRADRFRPCRLFVPGGAGGARQARAAAMALIRFRFRHRGGLVRPVPLFAARASR